MASLAPGGSEKANSKAALRRPKPSEGCAPCVAAPLDQPYDVSVVEIGDVPASGSRENAA